MSIVQQTTAYAFSATVPLGFDDAVARVKDELAREGFGILCEIDVAATMKKKLDVDFRRYVILGACNPPLAFKALTAERDIGVLLPCNVVVYEDDVPGRSVVTAMDPVAALALTGNEQVRPIAEDVRVRLTRALEAVAASPAE